MKKTMAVLVAIMMAPPLVVFAESSDPASYSQQMQAPMPVMSPSAPFSSPAPSAPQTSQTQNFMGGPLSPATPPQASTNPAPANQNTDTSKLDAQIKALQKQIEKMQKDLDKLDAKKVKLEMERSEKEQQLEKIKEALDLIQKLFDPKLSNMEKTVIKTNIEMMIGGGFKLNINNVQATVLTLQNMQKAREKELKTLDKKIDAAKKAADTMREKLEKAKEKLQTLISERMAIEMKKSLNPAF